MQEIEGVKRIHTRYLPAGLIVASGGGGAVGVRCNGRRSCAGRKRRNGRGGGQA